MDNLMQTLFYHIIDHTYARYLDKTAYAALAGQRDAVGRRLWERLNSEDRELLEELQRGYDRTQMAEFEAIYLASFDQCKALAQSHTVQNVS